MAQKIELIIRLFSGLVDDEDDDGGKKSIPCNLTSLLQYSFIGIATGYNKACPVSMMVNGSLSPLGSEAFFSCLGVIKSGTMFVCTQFLNKLC